MGRDCSGDSVLWFAHAASGRTRRLRPFSARSPQSPQCLSSGNLSVSYPARHVSHIESAPLLPGPGRRCSPCGCSSTRADRPPSGPPFQSSSVSTLVTSASSFGSFCFIPEKLLRSVLATKTTWTPGTAAIWSDDVDAGRILDHCHNHQVLVRGLPVVASPERAVLSGALAAPSRRGYLSELSRPRPPSPPCPPSAG